MREPLRAPGILWVRAAGCLLLACFASFHLRAASLDNSLTNFTSNLPIVILETGNRYMYGRGDALVKARLINLSNGRSSIGERPEYEGRALIRVHGTSTSRLPKSSFNFHPVDEKTNQVKISIFGLPKEEDWVLYAPYEDKTMMRDVLAYELFSKMGRYSPRTRYVELFLSTGNRPLSRNDYEGVYVLVEKIKRGKNRVNIEKLEPSAKAEPEISGGYIFKRDHGDSGQNGFYTLLGGPYFQVYPKERDISTAQRLWLRGYMEKFERALMGAAFADPQKGYAAYLDVDSFIDAHWLIEVSKNVDGFRYSSFITKERNGKLKTEPPWDWNRSFGNADYMGAWEVNSWNWLYLRQNEISWYRRLREDPEFLRRCRERWVELRKSVFDPIQITTRIDELAVQLDEAQKRNFRRWPILGERVTSNYFVGGTFDEEVRWLKNWIKQRIAWLDRQMTAPKKANTENPI